MSSLSLVFMSYTGFFFSQSALKSNLHVLTLPDRYMFKGQLSLQEKTWGKADINGEYSDSLK